MEDLESFRQEARKAAFNLSYAVECHLRAPEGDFPDRVRQQWRDEVEARNSVYASVIKRAFAAGHQGEFI